MKRSCWKVNRSFHHIFFSFQASHSVLYTSWYKNLWVEPAFTTSPRGLCEFTFNSYSKKKLVNKGSNFDHCEANFRVYVIFYWTLGLCGKKSILQVMFFLAFIPYVQSWHTMEGTENFSLYPLRWRVYIYRELLKEKV